MEKHQPPKTVSEIGIILYYMNEDISETKELLKGLSGVYAAKSGLEGLEEDVKAIKLDYVTKDTHKTLTERVQLLEEDKPSRKSGGGSLDTKDKVVLAAASIATGLGVMLSTIFGGK